MACTILSAPAPFMRWCESCLSEVDISGEDGQVGHQPYCTAQHPRAAGVPEPFDAKAEYARCNHCHALNHADATTGMSHTLACPAFHDLRLQEGTAWQHPELWVEGPATKAVHQLLEDSTKLHQYDEQPHAFPHRIINDRAVVECLRCKNIINSDVPRYLQQHGLHCPHNCIAASSKPDPRCPDDWATRCHICAQPNIAYHAMWNNHLETCPAYYDIRLQRTNRHPDNPLWQTSPGVQRAQDARAQLRSLKAAMLQLPDTPDSSPVGGGELDPGDTTRRRRKSNAHTQDAPLATG